MKKFVRVIFCVVSACAILLAYDYTRIRAVDDQVRTEVEACGGKIGATKVFPFRTQYRVIFERPLTREQMSSLVLLNDASDQVQLAFFDCDLSDSDVEALKAAFPKCAIRVSDAKRNQLFQLVQNPYKNLQ